MSNTLRIACAVLAGYYLGRRRKLRMAAALAAAGLAGRAKGGKGGGLLAQGIKVLGSSPEVGQLTDRLRGDLMEVGKAAAVAATSRKMDSLSDKLHERAEALRTPDEGAAKQNGAASQNGETDQGETDQNGEAEQNGQAKPGAAGKRSGAAKPGGEAKPTGVNGRG
jgi:hypothetical protein